MYQSLVSGISDEERSLIRDEGLGLKRVSLDRDPRPITKALGGLSFLNVHGIPCHD